MKKLLPVAIISVAGMLFTSCKKDYTCTCTETITSSTMNGTTTVTFPLGKQTKSKATSMCNDEQTTANTSVGNSASDVVTCHL